MIKGYIQMSISLSFFSELITKDNFVFLNQTTYRNAV
jgi:hypothetical protein